MHAFCRVSPTVLVLTVLMTAGQAAGQTFQLASAPGGISLTQAGSQYSGSFGTLNALGIGPPAAGVTVIALSNGALYFTPYQIIASGLPGNHKAGVTGFVSSNFGHPAALIMESCPDTLGCNTASQYSVMSTNAGAPTTIVPAPGMGNQTVTAGLAIFLPDNNGASAFTGNDSAQISLTMTDLNNNRPVGTVTILLNNETLQDAVQLTLGTAPGGVTITPASDFTMSFGNVNALGIGPGAGLSTVSAPGGIIYSTSYLLNPAFSNFASTTASIRVYVSTDFAHPAILQLNDAGSSGGPYSAISKNAGAQTQITSSATDRASLTRFLGLFVANTNGPTAFTGTDNATLTFTLTVP